MRGARESRLTEGKCIFKMAPQILLLLSLLLLIVL